MAQTWMDSKGRTMRGGQSVNPEVKEGMRRQTESAIASEYGRRGGGYAVGPDGRPGKPLDQSLYRESGRDAMVALGNMETGFGATGSGAATQVVLDDNYYELLRRDKQDRGELEKMYRDRDENRSMLAKARKTMDGGNYSITGLK
jgi:hypothetical protein